MRFSLSSAAFYYMFFTLNASAVLAQPDVAARGTIGIKPQPIQTCHPCGGPPICAKGRLCEEKRYFCFAETNIICPLYGMFVTGGIDWKDILAAIVVRVPSLLSRSEFELLGLYPNGKLACIQDYAIVKGAPISAHP
ncbi:hypothetical protein C8R46DRAFT_1047221 [Mycena filopes]|nr:hypothetical protein C8R46DRAFT_1047221 [Mycena filopes]